MAPTSRIQRRQTDVERSEGLVERQRQTRDAPCGKRWLRFRCKKKSLDVNVSLQGPSTDHDASTSPRSSGSDTEGEIGDGSAASLEPAGELFSAGGLLKRSLGDLLGTDDDETEDESEDENDSRNHVDFRLPIPLSNPLSQLLPHPLPLPSLPPNPIAALLPQPPPESPPPTAGSPASSPQPPPPPAASPAAPPATAPSQSHVPPSISIPPAASPTNGISENLGAPSPSTTNPPRSSFSAPLPKSTSTGHYSDDGGDDSDDDGDDDGSSSTGKHSSTRTRTTLTAIAPPYETQTTASSGERSTISRTTDVPNSFTTSVIVPDQTARTKTGAQVTTATSTASPSGTAAAVLGHEARRLSPTGEKAVIASTSIGECVSSLLSVHKTYYFDVRWMHHSSSSRLVSLAPGQA